MHVQVDDDAFTRKQGLYVMEQAVTAVPEPAQQAWQALLHLLALLEDFALHLIKVSSLTNQTYVSLHVYQRLPC